MPLREQDRAKLDQIVSQMEANREPEENIRFVVDDFKSKYEGQRQQPPGFSKSPMQLQHEHNINRGLEAEAQFAPIAAESKMIAEPVRMLGMFGGPAGAALGEAGAETIEQAGGAREGYDPVAIGAQAAIPAAVSLGVKGVSKAAPVISDKLRQSAQRQYSKVLGPTTKENKILTERVVPQLLEKKVRAGTRAGLMAKAGGKAEQAGEDLEVAYAALPQDAKVQFVPVLQQIQKAKDKLVVQGTDEIVDQDLYKALNKVQDKVLRIAGGAEDVSPRIPEASVATTRSARQAFDTSIQKKTKIFGKTGKETAKLEAQKEAANAIRAELAQEYPDVAKINKEFNLWKTVEDVLGETQTRTASQATPLGERIVTAGGVAGGLATGGIGNAVAYATGLKLLSKAVNSTAWRTVSAVEKNRLADLLASGKTAEAEISLAKVLGKAAAPRENPARQALEDTSRVTMRDIEDILAQRAQERGEFPLARSRPGERGSIRFGGPENPEANAFSPKPPEEEWFSGFSPRFQQRRIEAQQRSASPEYHAQLSAIGLTPDEIRIHTTPTSQLNEVEQAVKKEVRHRVIQSGLADVDRSVSNLVEGTTNEAVKFNSALRQLEEKRRKP